MNGRQRASARANCGEVPILSIALSGCDLHQSKVVLMSACGKVPLVDSCYISEEACVRDSQTLKAIDMSRLVEMLVKGSASHIYEVSAYLAGELDTESVKLIQPEGDGFPVPR